MSLTGRVIFSFVLIALVGFAFLLNPILDRVERQYLEAIEEPMVDTAEILSGILSNQIDQKVVVPDYWIRGMDQVNQRSLQARIYNLVKEKVLMDFYVTDINGLIVYDSGDTASIGDDYSQFNDVYRTLRGEYGARSTKKEENDPASTVMYVGAPIQGNGKIVGMVSVYKPQGSMLAFVIETKRQLVLLSAVALALVILLGWLLSRWATRPLADLTDYAAAVASGKRPPTPKLPGHHLRVLGETTEAMRVALENHKYVESYVQSLTHEMKSPVAGIRGAAELLYEDLPAEKRIQFLGNIESETSRLQNLVDQLLALASLESRTELGKPTRVSLGELAERVIEQYKPSTSDKRLRIEFSNTGSNSVLGEPFLLETAISNLLQNAIGFSHPGGEIRVEVYSNKSEVTLKVTDSGTGIPGYALDRVFDRFYSLPRPGQDRKSSGLGLCFAREAVALHRGELTVKNRTGEPGVQATMKLPR